jgi:hypothetical protein
MTEAMRELTVDEMDSVSGGCPCDGKGKDCNCPPPRPQNLGPGQAP